MKNVKKINEFEDEFPLRSKILLFLIVAGDVVIGIFCMPIYIIWRLFHKKQDKVEPEEKEIKTRNYKAEVNE